MKDFRISRIKTRNLEKDDFLWTIIEPIWPSTNNEDKIKYIAQGTPGQKALYSITLFIREVENGGLESFLFNSSGKYINLVISGLALIKAEEHLKVLKEAIKIFPNSKVPIRKFFRNLILKMELRKRALTAEEYFDAFNVKLYGEEILQEFFIKYINENEAEFFVD